jgi:NAD(P)-dependent dehydrogenase (short-subunit alcohol dehydrogenase family)
MVTGGGRGLGLAMTEALAEAGSKVVICSRKEEICKEPAQGIAEQGGYAVGAICGGLAQADACVLRV